MAFLLNRTTFLSHLRSHSQKMEDSISLSCRGFHIEPGPREKALLAEDPSLKRFKSHKKSVWRLKRIGDVLTIIVVADDLCYFVRIQRRLGGAVHCSNVAHWKAHWMVIGSLLGVTKTVSRDRIACCVSLGITEIPQQFRYARCERRAVMRIIAGTSRQHFVCLHKELLYKLYNGKRYFSSVANRTMYIGKKNFSSVASQVFNEISESIYAREPAKQLKAHEALVAFHYMNGLGKKPTEFNFCTALNSCAKMLNWQLGLQIHAQVIQTGNEENLFIGSALVDVYAKFGALADARRLFDGMKWHDQVSWTSIISGFSQNGRGREAILLFKEMLLTQIKPNSFTYVSVISACTSLELAFECGMSLHAHVIELGIDVNSFVVSSLIDCYSKCGRVVQAIKLFDATAKRDIVLLNSMISGYSKNMYGKEALELFIQMQDDNLSPTNHTLTSILNACGSLTALQEGRQLHALVAKKGLSCNVFVASALIDMYSKCGSIDEACHVFDQTIEKNSVLWTSMISGYAQSGRGSNALELFDYLVTEKGYIPDHVCFTAVLTACNHSGFLDRGIEYFNKMRGDYGLVPELDQYACLVDLYAKNGHLREAKELMEDMPFAPNSIMWSSFLSSCKMYGEVELGREAAFKLLKMEPHSAVPYLTLAHIYAGVGLWSEMVEIRKLMKFKEIKRSTGCSSVEIGKKVHFFTAGDISHPQLSEIYVEMEKLNMEMRDAEYMPQHAKELENIDDG